MHVIGGHSVLRRAKLAYMCKCFNKVNIHRSPSSVLCLCADFGGRCRWASCFHSPQLHVWGGGEYASRHHGGTSSCQGHWCCQQSCQVANKQFVTFYKHTQISARRQIHLSNLKVLTKDNMFVRGVTVHIFMYRTNSSVFYLNICSIIECRTQSTV